MRKPFTQIRLLAFFILLSSASFGQSLSVEVNSIYNFKPAKLSDANQTIKSGQLDKFWAKVKSDTTIYLPQLRVELMAPAHNPYFYFDGSELLLSLSKTHHDEQLAADAIAKCSLDDISQREYVRVLNQLAADSINVTNAAVKILHDPKFSFYLPEHAMKFEHAYCLVYMLLPSNSNFYIDTLIASFKNVGQVSQKSIIVALWFAYTCKGDSMINAIKNDKSISKDVRNDAKQSMLDKDLSKDEKEYIRDLGENKLDEVRKDAMLRFSDEATGDLYLTTKMLRKNASCH